MTEKLPSITRTGSRIPSRAAFNLIARAFSR
jgi:hypothetical protein